MNSTEKYSVIELLLRCKNGDESAFEALVSAYTPMMKGVIGRMNLDEAEFFSDACIALYKAALSFDTEQGEVTFGLYAKVCVTNRLTDVLRSKKDVTVSLLGDSVLEQIAVSDGVLSRLEKQEEREQFHARARAALSEYEYRVLGLWLRLDKTAAIAEELCTTAKSVDNAKARILKKLREAFST